MCVQTCTCVAYIHFPVCNCAHVYVKDRGQCQVSSSVALHYLFDTGSWSGGILELIISRLLGLWAQTPPVSVSPATPHPAFPWVLGIWFKSKRSNSREKNQLIIAQVVVLLTFKTQAPWSAMDCLLGKYLRALITDPAQAQTQLSTVRGPQSLWPSELGRGWPLSLGHFFWWDRTLGMKTLYGSQPQSEHTFSVASETRWFLLGTKIRPGRCKQ